MNADEFAITLDKVYPTLKNPKVLDATCRCPIHVKGGKHRITDPFNSLVLTTDQLEMLGFELAAEEMRAPRRREARRRYD